MEKKTYSFKKGLGKTLLSMALVGIPIIAQLLPSDVLNLTLGGLLVLGLNYVKTVYSTL